MTERPDPAKVIPGPDPGACPSCGEWRKSGMIHNCGNNPVNDPAKVIAEALAEKLHWLADPERAQELAEAVLAALAAAGFPVGEPRDAAVPAPDNPPVTLAFWECGHIEVDRGRSHACPLEVCGATYARYAPVPTDPPGKPDAQSVPDQSCPACGGSGDRNGNGRAADPFGTCPGCNGTGVRPAAANSYTLTAQTTAAHAWDAGFAAGRAADQHLRDALTKIEKLVAKWDAPIRHDVDDRRAYEKWAAVGSEAHKIASAALAASSRDTPDDPVDDAMIGRYLADTGATPEDTDE